MTWSIRNANRASHSEDPGSIASSCRAGYPTDADRLGGMKITVDSAEPREPAATLTGRLKDQAQLSGVLNTLYEMHLTILTVQAVAEDSNHEDKEENK